MKIKLTLLILVFIWLIYHPIENFWLGDIQTLSALTEQFDYIAIMKTSGFKAEFLKDGLMKGRGLYIGIKS